MTSPDDLTSLFTDPTDGTDLPFRQGVILSFDQSTGSNTVNVGGAILTDVPLLNIGDTINLVAGNIVVLMKMKSSWAILGRVITPGSASLTGYIVQTALAEGTSAAGFATTTSLAAYSISIPTFVIPNWCNHVDVLCIASASVNNSTAAKTVLTVAAQAGASVGPEQYVNVPAGDYGTVTTTHTATVSGPGLGGTSFNCATLIKSSVAYTTLASNIAQTSAVALYTRV
jgi:hypothetical protein